MNTYIKFISNTLKICILKISKYSLTKLINLKITFHSLVDTCSLIVVTVV